MICFWIFKVDDHINNTIFIRLKAKFELKQATREIVCHWRKKNQFFYDYSIKFSIQFDIFLCIKSMKYIRITKKAMTKFQKTIQLLYLVLHLSKPIKSLHISRMIMIMVVMMMNFYLQTHRMKMNTRQVTILYEHDAQWKIQFVFKFKMYSM